MARVSWQWGIKASTTSPTVCIAVLSALRIASLDAERPITNDPGNSRVMLLLTLLFASSGNTNSSLFGVLLVHDRRYYFDSWHLNWLTINPCALCNSCTTYETRKSFSKTLAFVNYAGPRTYDGTRKQTTHVSLSVFSYNILLKQLKRCILNSRFRMVY